MAQADNSLTPFDVAIASIPVRDIDDAIAFYRDKLGFSTVAYRNGDVFALVKRGNVELGLTMEKDGSRAGAGGSYFRVGDVDAVYREYLDAGIRILQAPAMQEFGLRDFVFEDLYGNRFGIGGPSEPATGVRFTQKTIILPVSDIYSTIDWYEKALGFQTRYIHGSGRRGEAKDYANYLIMFRDEVEVHFILDESNGGAGGAATGWQKPGNGYLGLTVSDADAIFAQVRTAGVATDGDVRKMNWPARGFNLKDPDGNEIHIEQPL